MKAQFPSLPSGRGSFPRKFRQLPVTDHRNISTGYQTNWTAFLFFVSLFLLFFFQLGPRFHCSDFIFDIWLGPEKLRDFKFGKRAPGVGSCLSLYSERVRGERNEKCS